MDKYTFRKMIPYLLVCTLAFFILPLFGKNTVSYIIILLVLMPLVCFFTSLIYSRRYSFDILFSMLVGIVFMPTIFIYYNSTAWIYAVGYTIISIVGGLIGKNAR